MKNTLIITTLLLLVSCKPETETPKEERETRIHLVDHNPNYYKPNLSIIEVDGNEYLVNYDGGIIALPKK